MAENSTVSCPHCGQQYTVTAQQREQSRGRSINCTRCGQAFTVDGATPVSAVAGGLAGAPAPQFRSPGAPGGGYQPAGQAVDQYSMPPAPRRTSAAAVASLVFGCLFFIPIIAPLLAIILGIVGISKTRDGRAGGRGLAIAGLSLGAAGLLFSGCMVSVLLPSLNRARETANKIKCASNMRQIGSALQQYAAMNGGEFPDRLERIIETLDTLDTPSADFICPATNDTGASGATPQARAADLTAGGHLSYIYTGAGETTSSVPSTVILSENPSNHYGDGGNVLHVDGSVTFMPARGTGLKTTTPPSGIKRNSNRRTPPAPRLPAPPTPAE